MHVARIEKEDSKCYAYDAHESHHQALKQLRLCFDISAQILPAHSEPAPKTKHVPTFGLLSPVSFEIGMVKGLVVVQLALFALNGTRVCQ